MWPENNGRAVFSRGKKWVLGKNRLHGEKQASVAAGRTGGGSLENPICGLPAWALRRLSGTRLNEEK